MKGMLERIRGIRKAVSEKPHLISVRHMIRLLIRNVMNGSMKRDFEREFGKKDKD